MKSENLNFLEPSGPVQACNGIALQIRAEKLQNYTKHTENVCMYSVNFPFRVCGKCITQISILTCVGINIKLVLLDH